MVQLIPDYALGFLYLKSSSKSRIYSRYELPSALADGRCLGRDSALAKQKMRFLIASAEFTLKRKGKLFYRKFG
jgi:hypothetical protein